MNIFDIGDVVRLRGSFTNSAGTAVDPSSLTLQLRRFLDDPSSFSTLVYGVNSVVRASVGEYYHDFSVSSGSQAGEWRYRWNGTGDNAAAGEQQIMFRVRFVGG